MKIVKDRKAWKNNKKNRDRYLSEIGINPAFLVSADLAHGKEVKIVDRAERGKIIPNVDGLLTGKKNIYLSVTTADCLPVFLFDPKRKIVGIVHAGWRSLEENILKNAILKMQNEFHSVPDNILIGIGPSICRKHYEVGPKVAKKFKRYPEATKKEKSGKLFFDLRKTAAGQLSDLGINKKNIEISPECTFEDSHKYFSDRRDRQGKKQEIRAMMAIIGMKK